MFDIDLNQHSGGPHWLSMKNPGMRAAIRAKHRARWEAAHPRERNPIKADTLAALNAAIEKSKQAEQTRAGRYRHKIAVVYSQAIRILDHSEPDLRDLIERGIAQIQPGVRVTRALSTTNRLMRSIRELRKAAFKAAFRHVRDNLSRVPTREIIARLLAEDLTRIDNTIRTGLIAGLPNDQVAQKVVGSMSLDGIDGATEITRQKIARLGLAAMRRK